MSGRLQTEEQILNRYKQLRNELGELSQKINEIEADANEHALVLKTLEPVDADRKCFRLVGGVLVEQTVGLVKPHVESKANNLRQLIDKLTAAYEAKNTETLAFQKEYKIRVQGEPDVQEAKSTGPKQQGVLEEAVS